MELENIADLLVVENRGGRRDLETSVTTARLRVRSPPTTPLFMYFIYDTETSGVGPDAHLMQVGAVVLDSALNEVGHYNALVQLPDECEIHPKAFEAHGLTRERVNAEGVNAAVALGALRALALGPQSPAALAIAFNNKFDIAMLDAMSKRYMVPNPLDGLGHLCMMTKMTGICKLPGKWRGSYKWPKLQEAYMYCYGRPFDGAHDALSDVRATAAVWRWYQAHSAKPGAGHTRAVQQALAMGHAAIANLNLV